MLLSQFSIIKKVELAAARRLPCVIGNLHNLYDIDLSEAFCPFDSFVANLAAFNVL